ncbi:ferritin [Clostridium fallax]|uniref:Ferritin n=2 Tax=Clostridium fallax TaxID=1533 RepID=A0A1M4XLT6_9CLOT|nr:ferritin [Clostridium fallax]SHE94213.1 ferritin [Clostridium fallax]SQB06365.1 ferritin [Clostridium fallax]
MVSKKLENLINDQINYELYSAYLYLSMSNYFESKGLKGFANWFMVQYKEETDHAMFFYKYLQNAGGTVKFNSIPKPQDSFESPMDVFQTTLSHEHKISELINNLATIARDESDFRTSQFLLWFISEQAEEEANTEDNIKRLKLAGDSGLLLLDQELGQRVYAIAANPPFVL